MLRKLLFIHQKPVLLFIAVFGAFVGFLLLLGSLQAYFDFDAVINGTSDISKPQYLVINKEVNLLNTLFGGQKGFTAGEIAAIKKIHGVRDAAGLTSSKFKVSVSLGEGGMQGIPGMYTELFFESVPDAFIDVDQSAWKWQEGDSLVPIVVPRDYIKLYNFGFAPAQGLPPMTESIVGLARFQITIKGKTGNAVFRGKLAGFSERINTILAPKSFVDYANKKFAGSDPDSSDPSRVIIECEGPATTELASYFAENGYETSAEALRNSRLNSVLQATTSLIVFIGAVILLLAILGFLLYSQLLLSRSSYEIETLIRIGYDYRKLLVIFMRYYAAVYAGILAASLALVWLGKKWLNGYAVAKGIELPASMDGRIVLYGTAFTLIFLAVNYLAVRNGLRKLAR
jgi:hypothetical protein